MFFESFEKKIFVAKLIFTNLQQKLQIEANNLEKQVELSEKFQIPRTPIMKRKYSIEERRSKILNMLHTEGRVHVSDLVDTFDVSEVSIRKDLAVLEERKLLVRVKGGAIVLHQTGDYDDLSISHKQQLHAREKQLIGQYAASLVRDGERIIFDSGTTTMEIAKNLEKVNNLTVITNALDIAITLNS